MKKQLHLLKNILHDQHSNGQKHMFVSSTQNIYNLVSEIIHQLIMENYKNKCMSRKLSELLDGRALYYIIWCQYLFIAVSMEFGERRGEVHNKRD